MISILVAFVFEKQDTKSNLKKKKKEKKRSFESIDFQDNILNLMAIGELVDFFGLSFVNKTHYESFGPSDLNAE